MKILILILMFFLIGAFFIISENNLSLRDEKARGEAGDLYISWLGHLFENSKTVVGYVVKLDWLPEQG